MPALPVSLANFEVDYVYYHVGSAVQEDGVSTDQDVGAFWMGRSQAPLELAIELRAGVNSSILSPRDALRGSGQARAASTAAVPTCAQGKSTPTLGLGGLAGICLWR
jgi:hypothetical protein